ncbi:hypothetical protein F8S13_22650 [Chloroflexia bacterium SDU3-3]|nr:hypothetical protein F8S13_22650 [Chloroflexia bacterium SDU3-3]
MQDDMRVAQLRDVPAAQIQLAAANPRTDGAEDIAGLAASLSAGLAQRPTLLELGPEQYAVLTGERRVRAALAAGWATIPALVEEPLDPLAAHTRRVLENLHRKDLGPLDEARALRLDWLIANAVALELTEAAATAVAAGGSVQSALAPLTQVLLDAGWSATRPTVTQEQYLTARGLGMSTASLRKKLQLLTLTDAAQERLAALGLTEASVRAFARLDAAQQTTLLAALDADPSLVRKVKTIIQDVTARGYPLAHALALARGEVWSGVAETEGDETGGDLATDAPAGAARLGTPSTPGREAAPVLGAEAAAAAAQRSQAALAVLMGAEALSEAVATLSGPLGTDLAEVVRAAEELLRAALHQMQELIANEE